MRKLFVLFVSLQIAPGCGHAKTGPASTEGTAAPGTEAAAGQSRQHAALKMLLSHYQPTQLQDLLKINGVEAGIVKRIPSPAENPGVESVLLGVTRLKSDDGTILVVVPATLSVPVPQGPFPAVPTQAVFVFDNAGGLVRQLGGTVAADHINGDTAVVVSLGTADTWFAIITAWDPDETDSGDRHMISRVYVLERRIPQAVTVRHQPRDISFSIGSQARDQLPAKISFNGADAGRTTGIGLDGKEHDAGLIWDGKRRLFTGAAQITRDKRTLYKVLLDSSELFSASDLSPTPVN